MKQPPGIISYADSWLTILFLFLLGFFLPSVVQIQTSLDVQIKVEIGGNRQVYTNR